jgi:amino acid adenylation domain-containing protein
LRKKGVKSDHIVALLVERSIEMLIGELGILKANGAFLPIDPESPGERQKYMLKESASTLLLTTARFKKELEDEFEVLELEDGKLYKGNSTNLELERNEGDLAYVIFTSGSTGKPKGVLITHANFCPLVHWGYRFMGLDSTDRAINSLSSSFDASVWEIYIVLTSGASLYIVSKEVLFNPDVCFAFMRKNDITVLHGTPTWYQALIHPGKPFDTLKHMIMGGERLKYDLVKRGFEAAGPDCRIYNMYGPTETTIVAAALDIDRSNFKRYNDLASVPIGTPVANSFLLVLDRYLDMCPINVAGELYIAGDSLARGYLNDPEKTAGVFIKNVFREVGGPKLYRTGDLVRWLEDGTVEFLGRKDHQVKIRGFRIELGEIEKVLLSHHAIDECVVTAADHKGKSLAGNETHLCAYFVSKEAVVVSDLRQYLAGRFSGYMIPSYFVQMEELPLTSSGKTDRKALPAPEGSRPNLKETYVAPGSDLEKIIAAAWEEVLKVEMAGIHDSFFDLGGSSMDIIMLGRKLNQKLNREIPVVTLFTYPTISSLARHLSQSGKNVNLSNTDTPQTQILNKAQGKMKRTVTRLRSKEK